MIELFPRLEEDVFLTLYQKARKSQLTSLDFDWEAPSGFDRREIQALARVLTPVYLGEQSAMLGAAAALPQMFRAHETSVQLYLTSFLADEGRHFEILTRFYQRAGEQPARLREIPEMLRYHHRLRQGDRFDWAWGILISDLYSSLFYRLFAQARPEAVFGRISSAVLVDESRHKAFAHHYLKRALPRLDEDRRRGLVRMEEELIEIIDAIEGKLEAEARVLGLDGKEIVGRWVADIEYHARQIGLKPGAGGDGRDEGPGGGETAAGGEAEAARELLGVPEPAAADEEAEDGRQGAVAREAGDGSGRRLFTFSLARLGRPLAGAGARAADALRHCGACAVALLCRTRAIGGAVASGS
ncbi:MAG: hypothetical protein IRZ26_01435 [Clostridia bacterium]|nr:hypothetical protein [Clostridia bacterium]